MFIYTMKAGTIRFVGIVCVALAALVALIAFVPAYAGGDKPVSNNSPANTPADGTQESTGVTYRYEKVKSADDAASFLAQFGWVVDAGSAETAEVTVPDSFDKVFAGYDRLQHAQGLDLSDCKGKRVTRYTFTVTNYADWDGPVYANVLVYRNRVVGGDICSADVNGFIHGFERPAE